MVEYDVWLKYALFGDVDDIEPIHKALLNAYATRMNREIDAVIRAHGRNVVGEAIWHFYGAGGDLRDVLDAELGYERFAFMESVKVLYRDGFAAHCTHWSPGGAQSSLHLACYMLWDMDGIECWAFRGDRDMLEASLDVLQFALNLNSPACQESALHGLGHLAFEYKADVVPIIDRYLRDQKPVDALREYALLARTGRVM